MDLILKEILMRKCGNRICKLFKKQTITGEDVLTVIKDAIGNLAKLGVRACIAYVVCFVVGLLAAFAWCIINLFCSIEATPIFTVLHYCMDMADTSAVLWRLPILGALHIGIIYLIVGVVIPVLGKLKDRFRELKLVEYKGRKE